MRTSTSSGPASTTPATSASSTGPSAAGAAIYVSQDSGQKLAEAINRLLDGRVERERMGQEGIERITTQLNWDKSVEQLLAAYATALAGKSGS